MTEPAVAARATRRAAPTIAGGASVIAGVTAVGRMAGFARTAVLAEVLGATFLGNTYATANTVPNIVYEVVAGGALASLVVPVLSHPAARSHEPDSAEQLGRTTSALLTWTVLGLVPVAVIGALLARPIMAVLVGDTPVRHDEVAVGSLMLMIFMPQVVLYGIGIICSGVLQAHRRFFAPAAAPLVSSLVVTAAYLVFRWLPTGTEIGTVDRAGELTLAVGTTAGVVALTLTVLLPVSRMRLRLRPRFDFPPGFAARVRRLALAGVAVLIAQQASVIIALRLANAQRGAVIVFTLATAVFLLPWSLLAVPVATSAFPVLSAAAAAGDHRRFAETLRTAARVVLIGSLVAMGVLLAVADPAARLLLAAAPGTVTAPAQLAAAIRALAPGLIGYGLLALATRALYARGRPRAAALPAVAGWLTVMIVDLVATMLWPDAPRATVLGAGNTVGMTLAGVLLMRQLRVLRR